MVGRVDGGHLCLCKWATGLGSFSAESSACPGSQHDGLWEAGSASGSRCYRTERVCLDSQGCASCSTMMHIASHCKWIGSRYLICHQIQQLEYRFLLSSAYSYCQNFSLSLSYTTPTAGFRQAKQMTAYGNKPARAGRSTDSTSFFGCFRAQWRQPQHVWVIGYCWASLSHAFFTGKTCSCHCVGRLDK